MKIQQSLMLKKIKEYFWDTRKKIRNTSAKINDYIRLWIVQM